jgi:hypothetical protein
LKYFFFYLSIKGEWNNDSFEGEGILMFSYGGFIAGSFKDGKANG